MPSIRIWVVPQIIILSHVLWGSFFIFQTKEDSVHKHCYNVDSGFCLNIIEVFEENRNMKKIITLLMMFCVVFFNTTTNAFAISKESTEYPGQSEAADAIVEAIKSDDVDEIEAMFNSESREGIKDLHKKIENLISAIEGDILSYKSSGSYQKDNVDLGYKYSEVGFDITITTENKIYRLSVGWIKKCSSNPEKVGIEHIGLSLLNNEEKTIDFWETISLPYKKSVKYKKELGLLRDPGAIAYYSSMGYDSVVFTSSDETVVTVSSDGIVTPNGPGTAIVTRTLTNTQTGKTVITEYEVTVKFDLWQKIVWYFLFGFLWY